jgi:lysophospholipase L1-like esterase
MELGYAQTRILPLGESTTSWFNAMWRPKFCELLTADGINYDMIGPNTDKLADGSPVTAYDGNHAGFPGNESRDIKWQLGEFYGKQPTNIPDIIIILAGTNDAGWALEGGATEGTNSRGQSNAGVSDLIDKAAELYPNARILVSSIPPLAQTAYTNNGYTRSPGQAAANVVAFNNALPGLCATKAAGGKNVTFVDASSSLTLANDLESDGIHPKQSGNDKLATAFYNAVKSNLRLGFEYGLTPWFTYGTASINTANVKSGTQSGYFTNGGGNYVVTGLTPGATYKVKAWVKAVTGSDIWVVVTGFGGSGNNPGQKMTATSWTQSGDIVFTMGANNTEATLAAWTGNGSAAYFDDFTIVRTNCTNCRTANAELESSKQSESLTLKLHPNPANQEVSISLAGFEGESAVQVRMRDMAGKPLLGKQVKLGAGVDQITLPVGHLPQGLFFITVQGSKAAKTAKFVITK